MSNHVKNGHDKQGMEHKNLFITFYKFSITDWCRIESKDVQQSLNMFRKAAINLIKNFKNRNNSKTAISNIMFECLMDPQMIMRVIREN